MRGIIFLTCVLFGGALSSKILRSRGQGKIIGGANIAIRDAPYQLQLEVDGWLSCSASIIDKFYALTTASCVDGYNQRQLTLRSGSDRQDTGGQLHQVYRININPKYDDYLNDYDIAVLEVATPFRFDENTQPLTLATTEPATGSTVRATGWGRTSDEGSNVNQLRSVDIPVYPRSNCTFAYAGDITPRMICAGIEGKDACRGDTGGPLVQGNVQVGIVSWSYGCAEDGYPGVYTNIANTEILSFIRSFVSP